MKRQTSTAKRPPRSAARNRGSAHRSAPRDGGVAADRVTAAAEKAGQALADAVSAVVKALPGPSTRPADLVRLLEVNRDIAGRLLRVASAPDGCAALHVAPGPLPLRTALRAARSAGVRSSTIAAAEKAVDGFEALIRAEGGTRSQLEAIVADRRPAVRRRYEQSSKQSVYRGMTQLRGACCETWLSTTLLHPSSDPLRLDHVQVHGAIGLRRLRPGASVKFTYREFGGRGAVVSAAQPPSAFDLRPYLAHPPARMKATTVGQVVHYHLDEDLLGPRDRRDMLVAEHHAAVLERYRQPGTMPRRGAFVCPSLPAERLLFDVFVHESVFPGSPVELAVFDTGTDGIVNVNDPTRAADQMDVEERVELLGGSPVRIEAEELPGYEAMLAEIARKLKWDLSRFRGYRCRVQYPVLGWQVSMSLVPPERE